jgi:O-antigen/teichoic acid export membrane protein
MTSIKQVAIRGTIWTVLSFGTQSILRLAGNIALTKLLPTSAFGLMQLSNSMLIGLGMLSDTGIGPNINQSKRGDEPIFLDTAWTVQVLRGICIFLICCIVAVPAARFYGQDEIVGLLLLAGSSMLMLGFEGTSIHSLGRHLKVRQRETFALIEQVLPLVVMLLWAWLSPSVWALAAGYIITPIVRLFWTHYLVAGHQNRFAWDRSAVKEIFSFGKWIFFSTAATFFALQADRLILGKLAGFELLGIYGIALGLAELPRQVVARVSNQIVLPAISKLADRPRLELREKLLRNRRKVLLGAALMVAFLSCFGDGFIYLLYSGKFEYAAWMLPILAAGIWINVLHESIRQSLVAIGQPKYEAYGQFSKAVYMCISIPLGFHYFGMLGAVIAVACNDVLLYSFVLSGLQKESLSSLKQDLTMTGFLVFLIVSILIVRYFLGFGLPIDRYFSGL